ncbi:MAG: hypothetical protein IPP73_16005 [Chitinophagaceae bacterium]|nr:hypothetical protein [Chitinophagaceae bacterium]
MKYLFFFISGLSASLALVAQPDHRFFLKEDTIVLNAGQITWLLQFSPGNENNSKDSAGQTVPQLLFNLASQQKIVFYDAISGQPVPAGEIYTWQMPADTTETKLAGANKEFTLVRQKLNTGSFTSMRICQRLYLNTETGEISSTIKWVELLRNVYAVEGSFIGVRPYYRILYENEDAKNKVNH